MRLPSEIRHGRPRPEKRPCPCSVSRDPSRFRSDGLETSSLGCGRGKPDALRRLRREHGIPREHYPAAFALWIAEVTDGPVPRFEKVEREPPADGVVIEGDDL